MGLGSVLLKCDVKYTKVVSSTETSVMRLNSLQKTLLGTWLGRRAAGGTSLAHASSPEHWHGKSSITQMKVLVGSGLRSVPVSAVWAQRGWGEG